MSYRVLARKWRPQQFKDVVGQESVVKTLQNAVRSGRIAHAFVFSGVRGVGKTTTARILAKVLNCRAGLDPEPCGECVSCQEIADSGSVDVLEIDAASNTSVDNVREIRDSVQYGTARDRYKIFIIDEVHMLSKSAFNALLKTLEEPPEHVKFILATTERSKIPVTILSRCQQYEFRPIPFALIYERMELICQSEEVTISDYGLSTVSRVARGSLRDAQSTLDQVLALGGREITDEDVRSILGVIDEAVVLGIVDAVAARDRDRLLRALFELSKAGVSPQNFCRKLMGHIRNLMVCRVTGWDEELLHLPDSEKGPVSEQAQRFSELDLIRFYDVLNEAEVELKAHPHPFVHLEMNLMKLVELAALPSLEEVLGQLKGAEPPRMTAPVARPRVAAPPSPDQALPAPDAASRVPRPEPQVVSPEPGNQQPTGSAPREWAPVPSEETAEPARPVEAGEVSPVTFLARLQEQNAGLHAMVSQAARIQFKDNRLHIEFESEHSFAYDRVRDGESLKALNETAAEMTGSTVEVQVTLGAGGTEQKTDPSEHPKVKTFMEVFPGKFIVEEDK